MAEKPRPLRLSEPSLAAAAISINLVWPNFEPCPNLAKVELLFLTTSAKSSMVMLAPMAMPCMPDNELANRMPCLLSSPCIAAAFIKAPRLALATVKNVVTKNPPAATRPLNTVDTTLPTVPNIDPAPATLCVMLFTALLAKPADVAKPSVPLAALPELRLRLLVCAAASRVARVLVVVDAAAGAGPAFIGALAAALISLLTLVS